ncbi:hypothetical protein O9H85_16535 [Paenibacillus filicis]|uniref:Uncharacterized protein n=1 Tax=Paenibacillus gyeongsangnamensis TaxID=3388067 RepID=A0ABT4QBD8_9BACL|nr:hypothetical protein [Paenibacillus filicis]MCZ8514000.1 hypothetical protein [Paenibacillus filicis]
MPHEDHSKTTGTGNPEHLEKRCAAVFKLLSIGATGIIVLLAVGYALHYLL